MMRCDQVYKRYPGYQEALQKISIEKLPGEVVGVTGASGAGKWTLQKERPSMAKQ